MKNYMKVEFRPLAVNEAFGRSVAAAFIMPLDPTVEELTEVKTAVSEAVSNCIIHGYGAENMSDAEVAMSPESEPGNIIMECSLFNKGKLVISIEDMGAGIEDVEQARQPLFTTGDREERSGMGFTVMESFMDKVKVISSKGNGTTVIMTKYLDVCSG